VAPPPVSGAAVGYAGVCDGGGGVAVLVGGGVAELVACAEPVACAELDVWGELDAWGEVEAEAPPRAVEVALADEPLDDLEASPVGDGVRVPAAVDECPLVVGDGVKIDGTVEPPAVQAETVSARSTVPAADRPAISHAPWAATGGVRRIFMNPPRMRVR
jgi:hypothetical protein